MESVLGLQVHNDWTEVGEVCAGQIRCGGGAMVVIRVVDEVVWQVVVNYIDFRHLGCNLKGLVIKVGSAKAMDDGVNGGEGMEEM